MQAPEKPYLRTFLPFTQALSFISATLLLPAVVNAARAFGGSSSVVALVKPQFEVGRRHLKNGIVRDPLLQAAVCDEIAQVLTNLGWRVGARIPSPISGGDGNREFFLEAERE